MKNKSWFLLIMLAFIWGSSFWLIKQGLTILSPLQLALMRVGVAAICLLPFALMTPSKKTLPWIHLALIGLIGNLLPALLFAAAQQKIPSAVAGMLNSLQPLFTIAITMIAFRQSFPLTKIWGVLIGLTGTLILLTFNFNSETFSETFQYSLLVVLATFCYGIATNMIRAYCQTIPPISITSCSLSLYLLPCIIGLWILDTPQTIAQADAVLLPLSSIILLGAIGTAFALVFFNQLIQQSGPLFASTVTYLIPVVAIIWGLVDNEPLSLQQLVGMMVIFIGLKLSNSATKPSLAAVKDNKCINNTR